MRPPRIPLRALPRIQKLVPRPAAPTSPGIYVGEVPDDARAISGVATSIALFIGWSAEGPADRAVRIASFADYERDFGGLDQRSFLGYSVRHFFENGGTDAYVLRVTGPDGTEWSADDADFRTAVLDSFGPGTITDGIDLFSLLCVPGLTDPGTIAALQAHCRRRRAFLIVDSPEGAAVSDMEEVLAGLTGPDASHSALYYPWVSAADPLDQGARRAFPPCGFVAGVYARTDASHGVWKAPAGTGAGIAGAASLELAVSDAGNAQLNPLGINCLRAFPPYGPMIWGARTLHGHDARASEWKYVPVRRMALFLEESLYRGTQWAANEPNDESLWARIHMGAGAFMQDLYRRGAFQGRTPREAYFVKCDRETTTQPDVDQGVVNIHVGFAPLKPAEFVVMNLQHAAGETVT